ncbi:MAG TPA: hypothetical protein VHZ06_00905 [Marmoricola sp.]|nr:hypothetical protein [Marmoricola sp.]
MLHPTARVAELIGLHGLGGAKDLPVPAPFAIAGGTAALLVSFVILILAWRAPRYDAPPLAEAPSPTDHDEDADPLPGWAMDPRPGRSEDAASDGAWNSGGLRLPGLIANTLDSLWYRCVVRALGMAFTVFMVYVMYKGPDLIVNPTFGVFYVILWVGIVPASLLFGRFFYAISPVRTLFSLVSWVLRINPSKGVFDYPERLGYWPAALGLFAYVWQELVNPRGVYLGWDPPHPGVRGWLVAYFVIMFFGSAVFGDTWLARADPFEVYSSLLAKLSPWARRSDGDLVLRTPLANLATLVPRPGLVAVVAVLFGSTAFDSYKDTVRWNSVVTKLGINLEVTNTTALVLACLTIGVTFVIATKLTGVAETGPEAVPRRLLPQLLAHSMVPIIVGYMTAHYLSYFVEQGQATVVQLSDPMADGANLFGTANWSIDYWLSLHPTFLASSKVVAVVLGHIVGATAAHDRALRLLPKKHQITGQLALLVIMVVYTGTGLYLLFGS